MDKICFKCGVLRPLGDFYPHPRMADKHLNKCKLCTKRDVRERYQVAREARLAYDRARNATESRRAKWLVYTQRARLRHPDKTHARDAVAGALRNGRLTRGPCEYCASPKTEAHHDDYSRPLAVRWLCFRCHRQHMHGQTVSAPAPATDGAS